MERRHGSGLSFYEIVNFEKTGLDDLLYHAHVRHLDYGKQVIAEVGCVHRSSPPHLEQEG